MLGGTAFQCLSQKSEMVFLGLFFIFWEVSHWRWCRTSRNGVGEGRGLCPVGPASCEDEHFPRCVPGSALEAR